MIRSDLHIHSTASDGKLTPVELVASSIKIGLNVIAISDHDTIAGIPAALEAARLSRSIAVVPGIEINCDVTDGELHVLGYFLDYTDTGLINELTRLRESRRNRGIKMVEKLNALGIPVKWNRVQEIAGTGSVGRPHVAQAMLEGGFVASFREAFNRYIGRDGPAYVEREKITPSGAVKLILKSGGLPVLAHPADVPELERFLDELVQSGLVGMEVYYNGYTPQVINNLAGLAASRRLLTTGGSDYHGLGGEAGGELGQPDVPEKCVIELFARAGKTLP